MRYITPNWSCIFVFKKECWCFGVSLLQKGARRDERKKEKEKKSKTLFHKQTERVLLLCRFTTAAFPRMAKQRLKLGDMF